MNHALNYHSQIDKDADAKSIHSADQIIELFNSVFFDSHNTRLCGGGDEPIYCPATGSNHFHQIIFTHDYFASALHEVAHWCVAGEQRRLETDYGYWYSPDGRNDTQQRLFEKVEIKPQALEWMFSKAANFRFRLSSDNLESNVAASLDFKRGVYSQVIAYCDFGVPRRALLFADGLRKCFGGVDFKNKNNYQIETL